jgi:hypothetical protein
MIVYLRLLAGFTSLFPAMWAKIQPKRITPVTAMTAFLPIAER